MNSNKKFVIILEILVITFLVMCVVSVCGLSDSSADISAYPNIVNPDDEITVTYSGAPGFKWDYIVMYKVGDPNEVEYYGWQYLAGEKSGTLFFTAPNEPGDYEFRLFESVEFTDIARSNIVTVQEGTTPSSEEAIILFDENFDDGYAPGFGNEVGDWEVRLLYPYTGMYTATTGTYKFSMAGDTNWQDYVIDADFFNAQDGGLLVRAQDQDNGIALIVRPRYNDIYWNVRKGGRWCASNKGLVTLGYEPGEELHVKIEVAGSEFAAYINGVLKTTLNTTEYPKGKIGLYLGKQSDQYWDNVVVSSCGATSPTPATPPPIAEKGLVAHYPFDDDYKDYSGNGNDGIPKGSMAFVDAEQGKGASFDGKSWIEVSDSDSLDLSNALTFSVWLYKQDAGTGGWAVVLSKGDTSARDSKSPYCLAHSHDGKSPSICLVKNNYREMIGTTAKTDFGEWYLLTVTWDGADIKYYINGELKDTKGWEGTLPNSNSKLIIGSDPPGATEYFRGVMDDLRIYDHALSGDEIKALYEGKGSSAPSPKPLEIVKLVKLFTAKSVYPRGEKVDVHYHIKNTGTVDVEEYHVEYDIIDVTGETVYKNVGGAHNISAGDENKWYSEKWEIPSDAEYGPCTIEARLKWDSETDTKTTDFLVTQATRAKDKTAELEITELYTSKFEYARGEAIKLCYRIKNVGTTDAEYHLCNIIEVEGEKVYWFIFSTHNIAAGEEQKRCAAAGHWKIPSDAKCGTYTIETTLVWDSKTVTKETTFIVK